MAVGDRAEVAQKSLCDAVPLLPREVAEGALAVSLNVLPIDRYYGEVQSYRFSFSVSGKNDRYIDIFDDTIPHSE